MTEQPSDSLRELYERRAERFYAEPISRRGRKFEGVWALLDDCLPCESFLDAGCGDGRYLVEVGPRAGRLAGVDISERILATAREALERAGLAAELRQGNLEALPFADGEFDLVLCSQVIEHLLAPERGLAELARVLQPGGRLLLTTDNRHSLSRVLNAPRSGFLLLVRGRKPAFEFPHRSFAVREIAGLTEEAGLRLECVETFRFHLDKPLDETRVPFVQRSLDALDRALPRHRFGDIVAVLARKP
jgi:SAM-dependent methyltransferase